MTEDERKRLARLLYDALEQSMAGGAEYVGPYDPDYSSAVLDGRLDLASAAEKFVTSISRKP